MSQPSSNEPDVTGEDARFMRAALQLGRRNMGLTGPNPSVGAIIVKNGIVLGRGVTARGGRPHAEAEAIAEAGAAARGATLYVTLEPCSHFGKTPPCVDGIISAGIARVVVSVHDPDPRINGAGIEKLKAAGIEVRSGVMAPVGRFDLAGHLIKHIRGRSFTTLKLAISADGFLSGAAGQPVKITCETATRHVHLMRAQHSGILVGIKTVLSDDPLLTCRLPGLEQRSPVRIVFDPDLRIPLRSRLIRTGVDVPVVVFTNDAASEKAGTLNALPGVTVSTFDAMPAALLAASGSRLMVEGGAETARRFLAAGQVDEAIIMQNPDIVIGNGVRAFPREDFSCMEDYICSFGLRLSRSYVLGQTRVSHFRSSFF